MKMIVEATALCFDGMKRQRPGQKFELESENQFSWKCMIPVGWEPKAKKPRDWQDPRDVKVHSTEEYVKAIKGRTPKKKAKLNHDTNETEFVTIDN